MLGSWVTGLWPADSQQGVAAAGARRLAEDHVGTISTAILQGTQALLQSIK